MTPLPGQYLEYYIGIGKDIHSNLTEQEFLALPDPEKWERALIKEPIGNFLGLRLAPPRRGTFKQGASNTNAGRKFAYRKQRGSRTFKFGLVPGTSILVAYLDRTVNGIEIVQEPRQVAEFQISLPRTCSVTEVIEWIQKGTIPSEQGERDDTSKESHVNAGKETDVNKPFDLITYIITPAGRKHPIRGIIDNKFVPESPGTATDPGEKPDIPSTSGAGNNNSGGLPPG